ncbi:UNVERIFIED_CONTAM: hypothetical protein GTU68_049071 [Idotea baltica]|nr:hypothetical protein [Idotea baltica]
MCSKAAHAKYRPFCSKRCADLDLAKWLDGRYAIPATDQDEAEAAMDEAERSSQKPH